MNIIEEKEIINIFSLLNREKLDYLLIRNINRELPVNLKIGKDIDLLVKKSDKKKFITFFLRNSYETIEHPFKDDVFLYGVNRFEFIYNNNNKILFDLNFQLAARSLDAGQWIPLDQTIQVSAWRNKRYEQISDDFGYWTLSHNDEFVTLVARSVFDKGKFQSGYIKRIEKLLCLVDMADVTNKLYKVFFGFTPYLLKHIQNKEYNLIIKSYLEYKEY